MLRSIALIVLACRLDAHGRRTPVQDLCMYPLHVERISCYLHTLYRKLPSLSPVSTAVGKLDIGCHVGPGQHQYREVICEVCSSHYQTYQVFLCPPCSSLECGPSAQSPPPRLHQESRGVGYPTTPSSSSVSTSFQSDSDRRASHTSSISTQDLDSSEANDSPGVRNAKKREEANANHAMNEKRRRDSEKEKFETLQKMVEDIDGVLIQRGSKHFAPKIIYWTPPSSASVSRISGLSGGKRKRTNINKMPRGIKRKGTNANESS